MPTDESLKNDDEITGLIFNIEREAIHDGPGIRTVVFLKGCPLHCPWCQNPEGIKPYPELMWYENRCIYEMKCINACPQNALTYIPMPSRRIVINRVKCDLCGKCIEACPTGALDIVGKRYTVKEVVDIIMRDKVFYEVSGGGVTISGGEPTTQPRFVMALLRKLRDLGIHTAIETALPLPWELTKPIIELVDLVIMDIKIMDPEKHVKYIGAPLERVLTNAINISKLGKPIWVHTPIIPGYTDYEENIRRIAEFIRDNLPTMERYELLAFNKYCSIKYERLGIDWPLKNANLIPEEKMEMLTNIARSILNNDHVLVTWRGIAKKRET